MIRAIRDVPDPVQSGHPWRTLVVAAVGLVVGGQLLVAGLAASQPLLALAGPALALWSSVSLLTPFVSRRLAVTIPCCLLLIYAVGAFTFLPSTFDDPGIEVFFVQGVILVFTAVAVVVANGASSIASAICSRRAVVGWRRASAWPTLSPSASEQGCCSACTR